ncbi:hypothetical protein [Peterkaempfera bronchialis]|uniref:Uncharacterized protein n=1 Tax=Peterkaempfera bronchialis TaxID=2126346 RepID=A0A345SU36_9ACTN|nr:hypothetical protein [Peterkaempfera bronchialis]AXI77241.1 hypothetical protein C7M71_007110 [Peterkaempfera bronchialis]
MLDPRRRRLSTFLAAPLLAALLLSGCSSSDKSTTSSGATAATATDDPHAGSASPTSTQDRVKLAKTKFVLNAGLAAGATYQWLYKPYKDGKFKKGASGRKAALVKGALAGAFTYNRLKAAIRDAQGDPTLSKAVAPLTAGVEKLKQAATNIRKGDNAEAGANQFEGVIDSFKQAGKSAGADVTNQVPSLSQLNSGS